MSNTCPTKYHRWQRIVPSFYSHTGRPSNMAIQKSPVGFDDFPGYKPPLLMVIFPVCHMWWHLRASHQMSHELSPFCPSWNMIEPLQSHWISSHTGVYIYIYPIIYIYIPFWNIKYSVTIPPPSGKLLHNYGKSPLFMGKSHVNGHVQ